MPTIQMQTGIGVCTGFFLLVPILCVLCTSFNAYFTNAGYCVQVLMPTIQMQTSIGVRTSLFLLCTLISHTSSYMMCTLF